MNSGRFLLILAIFLFLLVRLYHLGTPSIWFDEAFSYWASSEDPGKLLEVVKGEPHPPFHFFFLHFWLKLGSSEFLMRLPSVLFGLLTLIGLYLLAAYLFGRRTAIVSSFLYAAHFMAFYSDTDARMYAPFSAFVVLSFYFFARLLKEGKKTDAIGYTFFITLSLYTHYFGFFVILSQVIAFIASGFPRKWTVAVSWLCSAMLFLPWLFIMAGQAKERMGILMPPPSIYDLGSSLKIFAGIGAFIGDTSLKMIVLTAAEVIFLFLLGAGFYCILIKEKNSRINFYLLSAYVMIPLVLSYAAAVITHLHIYTVRYLLFLSPAFCIIIGAGVSLMNARKVKLFLIPAVSAFFIFNFVSFYNYNTDPKYWRQDWRSCVAYIERNSQAGDAILFNPPYCQFPFNYYYKNRNGRIEVEKESFTLSYNKEYFKEGGLEQLSLISLNEVLLKSLAEKHKRIWFITCQSVFYDPEKKIGKWLVDNGEVITAKSVKFETSQELGDIYVWLVRVKK